MSTFIEKPEVNNLETLYLDSTYDTCTVHMSDIVRTQEKRLTQLCRNYSNLLEVI